LSLSGIVPGTIVESHRNAAKDEDKLLNVCYFIDHEGNISGKYIKKNLWYVRVHATNASTEVLRLKLNQASRLELYLQSSCRYVS
tara:strand:+ start:19860 stop:20114 length:255 start_codon:yes stop_codon:yes gene_type:complete